MVLGEILYIGLNNGIKDGNERKKIKWNDVNCVLGWLAKDRGK